MKKYLLMLAAVIGLAGCGTPSEVPTSYVGKIQTPKGFQENIIQPSKFRLDKCWGYCDKLVLLEASDQVFNQEFKTFMPKDKLNLKYGVSITDACIDWDTTEKSLRSMHAKLKDVLPKRPRG